MNEHCFYTAQKQVNVRDFARNVVLHNTYTCTHKMSTIRNKIAELFQCDTFIFLFLNMYLCNVTVRWWWLLVTQEEKTYVLCLKSE